MSQWEAVAKHCYAKMDESRKQAVTARRALDGEDFECGPDWFSEEAVLIFMEEAARWKKAAEDAVELAS